MEHPQETYQSPFGWRYGSDAMRQLWSEVEKRRIWRRIWVALAEAQSEAGLVTSEQLAELRAHQGDIDWERAQEFERDLHHDLMAEVRTYAEQCPVGGAIIHLGATSMDIEDNADALRMRDACDMLLALLNKVLSALAARIEAEADTVTMAYTHLQPAEPTTLGYRLAQYGQDFLDDYRALCEARAAIRGKGLKGAVGTSASYAHLLAGSNCTPEQLEERVMQSLGLEAVPVSTQTHPRKQDYQVLSVLAGIAQSAYKFAFDLRLQQSPSFGEVAEPFGRQQVGSSAMPFKRNPIQAESICSMARVVAGLPRAAWDNAALSALERTLDDSANRRSILPEGFLAVEEILRRVLRIVEGLRINRAAIQRGMQRFGPFAATESLLMALVLAGADRQIMHETIRTASMRAWAAVEAGEANPLAELLAADAALTQYITGDEIRRIMADGAGVGDAPRRSRDLARVIRLELSEQDES
ncbi:MAG: adenylosuccinate lyase [Chloroflexi bacterium]|nr:adenylosuccinate lyase [Chloroflexota bacterium]